MFYRPKNEKAAAMVILLIILAVGIAALIILATIILRSFQSHRGLINSEIAYQAAAAGFRRVDFALLGLSVEEERYRADIPGFPEPFEEGGLSDLDANDLFMKAKCSYYAWVEDDDHEVEGSEHNPFNYRKKPGKDFEILGGDVFVCGNTNDSNGDEPGGVPILGDEIEEEMRDCCDVLAYEMATGKDNCRQINRDSYEDIDGDGIDDIIGDPDTDGDGIGERRECYINEWRAWGMDAWRCINKNAVNRCMNKDCAGVGDPKDVYQKSVDKILEMIWKIASTRDDIEKKKGLCQQYVLDEESKNPEIVIGRIYYPFKDDNWNEDWEDAGWVIKNQEDIKREELGHILQTKIKATYKNSKLNTEANWYGLRPNSLISEFHLISK